MTPIYQDHELPEGTICTERLYNMLQFAEYKGFVHKCRIYCKNRNVDIDQYIDMEASLQKGWKKIFFLPIDLAIGITENVRMSNRNRKATLEYLYDLKGEKIHVQLQDRKADEFVDTLQSILHAHGIESKKEYAIYVENSLFKIDLYIPDYKIAIEFDEAHHSEEKDKLREDLVSLVLGCNFIRVDEDMALKDALSMVLPVFLGKL